MHIFLNSLRQHKRRKRRRQSVYITTFASSSVVRPLCENLILRTRRTAGTARLGALIKKALHKFANSNHSACTCAHDNSMVEGNGDDFPLASKYFHRKYSQKIHFATFVDDWSIYLPCGHILRICTAPKTARICNRFSKYRVIQLTWTMNGARPAAGQGDPAPTLATLTRIFSRSEYSIGCFAMTIIYVFDASAGLYLWEARILFDCFRSSQYIDWLYI